MPSSKNSPAAAAIRHARGERDIAIVRELFEEYERSLGFDLCFQGFADELARLPGEYAPPGGRLLLAMSGNSPAGCAGIRKIDDGICELKRMYVRPAFRGHKLGRRLALVLIDEARQTGYTRMRLDTVSFMKEAIGLYHSLGFREIGPYRHNPIPGAIYMELAL